MGLQRTKHVGQLVSSVVCWRFAKQLSEYHWLYWAMYICKHAREQATLVMWKLTSRVDGSGVQSCTEQNDRAWSENTLQLLKQFRSGGFHQMLPNFKQLNKLQAIRCWAALQRPLGIILSPSLLDSSYQAPLFYTSYSFTARISSTGGSGYIRCYRDLSYRHICIFRVAFFLLIVN